VQADPFRRCCEMAEADRRTGAARLLCHGPSYVSYKVGEGGPGEEGVYRGKPKAEWTKEAPGVQNTFYDLES
jgi:hypothetical protein